MADWNRARIGDLCLLEKGSTGLAKALPGKYPLVTTGAERKSSKDYQFDTKAVCIPLVSSTGHGKKTLNYVHYQEGKFALGSILAALVPKDEKALSARYLHIYLQKNKDRVLVPLMKGAANVSLSMKAISNIEIPLPSPQKQAEIFDKIDSISTEHCALLNELDIQTNLLNQLRQAVLLEAIEGKLTVEWRKQNPNLISGENHTSMLLEKIRTEKELLIKEGKIRQETPLPKITDDEKPFTLPEGWAYCRLGEIGSTNIGLTYSPNNVSDSGTPVLRSNNIKDGAIDLNNLVRVKIKINENQYIQKGDILICARNGSKALIGKAAQIKEQSEAMTFGAFMTIFRSSCNNYLELFLQSPIFRKLLDKVNTMTINQLTQSNLKNTIVPLPPTHEQQAIVNRVEKLMAIIDNIEKQVDTHKVQLKMLMQTVLREVFEYGNY
jgi:type I restriction enzyme S subunit